MFRKQEEGVPIVDLRIINLSSIHGDSGSTPGLTQWVKDPLLLWLWHRLAAAAQIQPLAWEPPYATGMALKNICVCVCVCVCVYTHKTIEP